MSFKIVPGKDHKTRDGRRAVWVSGPVTEGDSIFRLEGCDRTRTYFWNGQPNYAFQDDPECIIGLWTAEDETRLSGSANVTWADSPQVIANETTKPDLEIATMKLRVTSTGVVAECDGGVSANLSLTFTGDKLTTVELIEEGE